MSKHKETYGTKKDCTEIFFEEENKEHLRKILQSALDLPEDELKGLEVVKATVREMPPPPEPELEPVIEAVTTSGTHIRVVMCTEPEQLFSHLARMRE